jgi:hypothetical protein
MTTTTERLMFLLACPVCGQRVTAYNYGVRWHIAVHRHVGERCAGSGKEVRQWRRET